MIAKRELLDAAMELPDEDRAEIAQRLFDSLPAGCDVLAHLSSEARESWRKELNRRIGEIERGEAELIPGGEVMRELHEEFDGQ